jgi:hypothetical protein
MVAGTKKRGIRALESFCYNINFLKLRNFAFIIKLSKLSLLKDTDIMLKAKKPKSLET